MIRVKFNKILYNLPTSWTEVSFLQWKKLQEANNWFFIISILCDGITENDLENVTLKSLRDLLPFLHWVKNNTQLNELPLPKEITIKKKKVQCPQNICEKTWGQKIAVHTKIKEEKKIAHCISFAAACYLLPEINKETFDPDKIERIETFATELEKRNLFEIYALGNNYIQQVIQQIKQESKLLGKQPKPEHLAAGVKMFDKFGVLNTIDALAGGDVLKYKQVQQIEYNVIFAKLLLNQTTSVYQENLNNVLRNRK